MNAPHPAVSPLRQRMLEDMRMRRLAPKTQTAYIRAVRRLAAYLHRPPDTATVEDLRNFQLYLVDQGASPITLNATITGLKFFCEITLDRAELTALMLQGAIVTIDAMGTHSNIARSIRDKQAHYVLSVKDNQPRLAESITTFFEIGLAQGWGSAPYTYSESVEKDHGRLEVRRCWAFSQLDCLSEPEQWPDLKMFGVIEAERTLNGKTSRERRLYIGSIAPEANAVRAHWGIENGLHWCLDVALNDDQMRARVKNAGANLAIVRRLVLNLFRMDTSRKGGIHIRRILAASCDAYRQSLLGLSLL